MYTTNLRIGNYNDRDYRVEINASWITVTANPGSKEAVGGAPTRVAKRHASEGDDGNWYDEPHQRVVDALRELEAAIFALVDHDQAKVKEATTDGER